jgi:hypothetical protein
MTGDISRGITLTTYGTAFLQNNYDISGLTLDHPSFTFENKVEFLFFKKHFFSKPTWHQYADSPINWLKKLKKEGCKELRLVFRPDNSISLNGQKVPDHKLAGFVGGGGHRYIQTIFEKSADLWQSKEVVTDKDAPDRRIWTISYGRTITGQQIQAKIQYNIDNIKQKLKGILTEISAFANKENQSFWSKEFDTAINLLDSPTPFVNNQDNRIIPAEKMNLKLIQLLAGSGKAWCFGGMGSWNDISFIDKDKQTTYDKLTAELYDIVNESYIAVANS